MGSEASLRGIVWDHPRGYEPLLAASRALSRAGWPAHVEWDRRPLAAFEHQPLAELTQVYDLLIIDHPHVGDVARYQLMEPFERTAIGPDLARLASSSLGPSFASYQYDGLTWALPIDAACQVSAWRPDLLGSVPATWDEVIDLASTGSVEIPLQVPHSLLCLLTLAAGTGATGNDRRILLQPNLGAAAFSALQALAANIDDDCFEFDPIDALERLAAGRSRYVPLVFGYCSYARSGFRPARVQFGDIPTSDAVGAHGSVLGGTGIAISARSASKSRAVEFAAYVAGESCQRELWAPAGGQPAHRSAWLDPDVAQSTAGFTSATLSTIERAYVRPRYPGYLRFQASGAQLVNQCLIDGSAPETAVARLNDLYAKSLNESGQR